MKRLIVISVLFFLLWHYELAWSGEYVMQYDKHISISLTSRLYENSLGHTAIAMRDDGYFVRGCYNIINDTVEIDWNENEHYEFPFKDFVWRE